MSVALNSAKRKRRRLFGLFGRIAVNAACVAACLIFVLPLVQMTLNSFKSNDEVLSNPTGLPIVWTIANYLDILDPSQGLLRNFMNSIFISLVSTVIAVFFCSAAAFAFAKLKFPGRNLLFALLVVTMMVPPEVSVPGLFLMFSKMGLINTLTGMILPTITPIVGLFLIRQYMNAIPDEMIEAAKIDGASNYVIFLQIVLPSAMPVVSAYAVLHFLHEWNAYLWPSLVATRADVKPLMVALPEIVDPIIGFVPAYGIIMAGCVLSLLPILVVFFLFREKIMESVTLGALK
jgi:ABC-type glycerol-3-phosphate transport system permease component